jgi:LasA protease
MNSIRPIWKLFSTGVLIWLILGLACNYPVPQREQGGLTGDELRATIAAGSVSEEPDPTQITLEAASPRDDPFAGLRTPTNEDDDSLRVTYYTRSGDTLPALAKRFDVDVDEILAPQSLPGEAFLKPGISLEIPKRVDNAPYSNALLPDSEILYGPSTVGFDINTYIAGAGGYLSTYGESVNGDYLSGSEIFQRVAVELSVNPRLLLAFLEYQSGWVFGGMEDPNGVTNPLGFNVPGYKGLYIELTFAATQLNIGYYGWRYGTHTMLQFHDQTSVRISPQLNPGTVAIQQLFAKLYDQKPWIEALYGPDNFLILYQDMFGDPWDRAALFEPFLLPDLTQPVLELPFVPGERWSFTGGPHPSWNTGTPYGGLDFSPVTGEPACVVSRAWATAAAPGVIVRSSYNVVVIDLDGDGHEGTGWTLMYLHIAEVDHVALGATVNIDDRIGHPSCERGKSTGTHVHLARKYNGEWLGADGPIPFVLSGWEAEAESKIYQGSLTQGGQSVVANPGGSQTSIIIR